MGVTASRTLSVASATDLADITFRPVDQSRYPDILALLYANFHTDEPMSRALRIFDGHHRVPAVDEFTLNALGENLSIMAVDSFTNKLLGVAINSRGLREHQRIPLEEKIEHIPHDKFLHIIAILHKVNARAPDLYDDLDTDVTFDIKMVTTDKDNRRGGLGTDLLRRSVETARKLGFKACKTEATGLYSRKAFERLGFSVAAEFPYAEYEHEGQRVFESLENHRVITLLVKKLLPPSQESIDEETEKTMANEEKLDGGK